MSIDEQRKLMAQVAKTKAGKALLTFIEDECTKKFKTNPEAIQMQAGKFNLWCDIQSEINIGKGETNG